MDDRLEVTVGAPSTRTSKTDNYDYNTGDRDLGASYSDSGGNAASLVCCIASHPAFQVM